MLLLVKTSFDNIKTYTSDLQECIWILYLNYLLVISITIYLNKKYNISSVKILLKLVLKKSLWLLIVESFKNYNVNRMMVLKYLTQHLR